eukprot:1183000-Prorocentrum_minimum.AAC.1
MQQAVVAISEADFLLFVSGAGFSADSGLPVYKVRHTHHAAWLAQSGRSSCHPEWLAIPLNVTA